MRSGLDHASLAIVVLPAIAACLPAVGPNATFGVSAAVAVPTNGGPTTRGPSHRGEAMVAANTACERCHTEVAVEWRASLHRASWTEPAFQRAFEREPLPFCQGCHVPEADPTSPPSDALAELGTGCVSCHLVPEGVLAAKDGHSPKRATSPHAVVRDGRLDGDAACARCHEFSFPSAKKPLGPDVPMQSTVGEHTASPAAGQSCATCHMPHAPGRRRSHRFASSRDEERIRSAVQVGAERSSPSSVAITLASNVRGHAFPTGDLFRRVEVLVEAVAPGEVLVASEAKYLGRHFPLISTSPGGMRHRAVGVDDRLGSEQRTITFDLGPEAARLPIRYRVGYQRVAHPRSNDESASELDGEIEIASGRLDP